MPRTAYPTSSSSPACPAPGGPPRPSPLRTSAGTWWTTCRPRCCPRCSTSRTGRRWPASPRSSTCGRRAFSTDLKSAISALARAASSPQVVFLEASDKDAGAAVRERAPAAPDAGLGHDHSTGITAERDLLREVRGDSDIVLDTSSLNVHELRSRMHGYFGGDSVTGAAAEHRVVRLQVRAAGGRGPGRRLPVPAEPALGARAAAADRPGRRRCATTCSPSRRRRSSSTRT